MRWRVLLAAMVCLGAEDDAARLLREANANYVAGHSAKAIHAYREYIRRFGDRADVRVYLGAALLGANRLEEALAEARQAAALNPRYAKAYVLAGRIHAERQNWDAAFELFDHAVTLDPRDSDAWYFHGRALYEANRFEGAIEKLTRAGGLQSGQGRVHEMLALSWEALGNASRAEENFRRAIQLSPASYRPHYAYGVFLLKQGRTAESAPLLAEALRLHPDSSEARFEYGRVLFQTGKLAEALDVLRTADASVCRMLNLRARVLAALDRAEESARDIQAHQQCEARSK